MRAAIAALRVEVPKTSATSFEVWKSKHLAANRGYDQLSGETL